MVYKRYPFPGNFSSLLGERLISFYPFRSGLDLSYNPGTFFYVFGLAPSWGDLLEPRGYGNMYNIEKGEYED